LAPGRPVLGGYFWGTLSPLVAGLTLCFTGEIELRPEPLSF
jgi:hypothetical protein